MVGIVPVVYIVLGEGSNLVKAACRIAVRVRACSVVVGETCIPVVVGTSAMAAQVVVASSEVVVILPLASHYSSCYAL